MNQGLLLTVSTLQMSGGTITSFYSQDGCSLVFKVGLKVVNILYVPLFWSVIGDCLGEELLVFVLDVLGTRFDVVCLETFCRKILITTSRVPSYLFRTQITF